jgi:hypothetical protein
MKLCRETIEMPLSEFGPMTKALHKVAYDLGLATIATHALEQSRNLSHGSEERRVEKARRAYDSLIRSLSIGHRELKRLEDMALDAYINAVPNPFEPDPQAIPIEPVPVGPYVDRYELPNPEARVAEGSGQQKHDQDHNE